MEEPTLPHREGILQKHLTNKGCRAAVFAPSSDDLTSKSLSQDKQKLVLSVHSEHLISQKQIPAD